MFAFQVFFACVCVCVCAGCQTNSIYPQPNSVRVYVITMNSLQEEEKGSNSIIYCAFLAALLYLTRRCCCCCCLQGRADGCFLIIIERRYVIHSLPSIHSATQIRKKERKKKKVNTESAHRRMARVLLVRSR